MRTGLALTIVLIGCGSSRAGDLFGTPEMGAAGGTTNGGSAETSGGGQPSGGKAGASGAENSPTNAGGTATGGGDLGGATGVGGAGDQGGAADAGGNAGGVAGARPCLPEVGELCDGLDNDGCDGPDDGPTCPAGCQGFAARADHGYMICIPEEPLAFDAAQAFCQAHDVEFGLVRVDAAAENTFLVNSVLSLTEQATELWIGASDAATEDEWLWLDGTLFYDHATGMVVGEGYENWADMRPNEGGVGEDCAALNVNVEGYHGLWNDENCDNHSIAFVCEGP